MKTNYLNCGGTRLGRRTDVFLIRYSELSYVKLIGILFTILLLLLLLDLCVCERKKFNEKELLSWPIFSTERQPTPNPLTLFQEIDANWFFDIDRRFKRTVGPMGLESKRFPMTLYYL